MRNQRAELWGTPLFGGAHVGVVKKQAWLKWKVGFHRERRTERAMPWRPPKENTEERQTSTVSDAVKRARELRQKAVSLGLVSSK